MDISKVTRALGKGKLLLKSHAPELLLGAGLVCGVAACVEACKATKKIDGILENHKEAVDKIHQGQEMVENGDLEPEKYTKKDIQRDTVIAYRDTGFSFVKAFWKAGLLGLLAFLCILSVFGILKSRYVGALATATALNKTLNTYRSRVIEEWGEDVDRHFMYGTKIEEIKETVEDPETGKKKTKKKMVEVIDADQEMESPFSRYFDDLNPHYSREADMNRIFICKTMDYWNRKLKDRGFVYLWEIYKTLGYEATRASYEYGWVYDPEKCIDGHVGDSYIQFKLFDVCRRKSADGLPDDKEFHDGLEPCVIIDFNVDEQPIAKYLPLKTV